MVPISAAAAGKRWSCSVKKGLLKLRDTRPELQEAKREGRIGIPCFLLENGEMLLEAEAVLALPAS